MINSRFFITALTAFYHCTFSVYHCTMDGRHFENPLNHHNSATVKQFAIKFGIMTHFNPLKLSHDQNFDFFKSEMVDDRCFEKSKIAISQQRFDRSPRTFAR